jgi:hypothetical protein
MAGIRMTFKPKCVNRNDKGGATGIAYNNRGFLLPCCFADGYQPNNEFSEFYDETLNLENSTVEEILTSDVWVDFFYNIMNGEPLYSTCKKICVESHDSDPYRDHIFLNKNEKK